MLILDATNQSQSGANQPKEVTVLSFTKTRKGFTLIELLVVIAIIAILAAILFPVFAQAKLSAKKASSVSNSKQITLGILQYIADVDDQLPMVEHGAPFSFRATWPVLVQPYIKNWQIFRDPTDGSASDSTYASNWGLPNPPSQSDLDIARGYGSSYGYNYSFLAPGAGTPGNEYFNGGVSQTVAANIAETVLLVDGTAWSASGSPPNCSSTGGGWYQVDAPAILDANGNNYSTTTLWNQGWYFADGLPCQWNRYGGALPRYNGKFNVAWLDGHVSTRAPLSMIAGVQYNAATPSQSRVIDPSVYVWDLN